MATDDDGLFGVYRELSRSIRGMADESAKGREELARFRAMIESQTEQNTRDIADLKDVKKFESRVVAVLEQRLGRRTGDVVWKIIAAAALFLATGGTLYGFISQQQPPSSSQDAPRLERPHAPPEPTSGPSGG